MPQITLNKRYQYNPDTDLLGEGGLGTVYKAYDSQQGRYVAIKKFNVSSASLKYSLKNEFQRSIHFSHGNLVRAYDFFSTTDTLSTGENHETQYGIMELIEGGDLASYLKTNPPHAELLEVVKGILYGLRYLHTRDLKTDKGVIIHRDIKPANILIYRNSQRQPIPKIADFNIAKEASTDLSTQTVVGTPEFMSPEQFLPKQYGSNGKLLPNTDLWSLGVLLCDHLLKKSVFGRRSTGQTQGEITDNVLNKPLPTTEIQKLPAPFKQIITACLVRHATDRIQSADALLTLIEQGGKTIIDPEPPRPDPDPDPDPAKPIRKPIDIVQYIAGGAVLVVMLLLAWLINGGTLPTPKNTDTIPTTPADDKSLDNKGKQDSAKYANLVQEANELYAQDRYREAKAKYEAASRLQPNNADIKKRIENCDTKLQTANTTQPTPLTKPAAQEPSTQTKPPPQPPTTTDPFAAQMVQVQGGTFMMGSPASEADRADDEQQHRVTLSTFSISKYEVTQAQWRAIMGNNSSKFSGCAQCPVEQVSYNDIQTFLQKLNAKTGKSYRLPTEAQWEYAARGGTTSPFNTGNCLSTSQANYDGNYPYQNCAKGQYRQKTTPVGSFAPNQYGLYDMHGNVWEWCGDWYDKDYYKNSPAKNPTGPTSGTNRVLRGGSWLYYAQYCRVANRSYYTPTIRDNISGFRLALVP